MSNLQLPIPAPPDWDFLGLEETCEVISRGQAPSYVEQSSVFAIGQRCVQESGFDASVARSHDDSKKSGLLFAQVDDILLNSTGTGTIGRTCIFRASGEYFVDGHVTLLRPKKDIANSRWIHALLQSSWGQNHLESRCYSGSTNQIELSRVRLSKSLFPFPSLPEQQAIAHILDTIDEAIATTTAYIDKLKLAKTGLLHDLLTRGIDDNGELRDPIRHPEHFKDSPFGKVPKNWEINTLGKVVERSSGFIQTGPFGSQLHAYEYVESGIPVIMPQDMRDGRINTEQIGYITSSKAQSLSRHIVQMNDIVFARRGDLNRCVAIGRREENWFCGTGCMLARISDQEVNGFWLAAMYRHYWGQRQVLAKAVGSTMVNLNSTLLNSLLIAKPEIPEQAAIVEKIDLQDRKIVSKIGRLEKLKLLKQGLMSDLLTGRVRGKVDSSEAG